MYVHVHAILSQEKRKKEKKVTGCRSQRVKETQAHEEYNIILRTTVVDRPLVATVCTVAASITYQRLPYTRGVVFAVEYQRSGTVGLCKDTENETSTLELWQWLEE